MITHIVLFKWRSGVNAEQCAAFAAALDALYAEMDGPVDVKHGCDLGYRASGNSDYALIARFTDRAAWDAYQADPRHRAFIETMVAPIVENRAAIQIDGNGARD